jgi:hypothetical protein
MILEVSVHADSIAFMPVARENYMVGSTYWNKAGELMVARQEKRVQRKRSETKHTPQVKFSPSLSSPLSYESINP